MTGSPGPRLPKSQIKAELARRSLKDWAARCSGYLVYGEDEWLAFFCGAYGDFNLEEWSCWMLAFYDRQGHF